MSKPNKGLKLAVLSLISIFALAACDEEEVYAKPADYDNPVVKFDGAEEKLQNNILSIIYDAMHDGSVSSKTLDEIMYRYAESVFGVYNGVTNKGKDEEITLKDAYVEYTKENSASNVKINKFIKAHKVYWNRDESGKHVDDEGNPVDDSLETWIPCDAERENVKSTWEKSIERRIAENMYSRISTGGYTENNFYSEKAFLKSLYQAGQKVNFNYNDAEDKFIIPYTLEAEDVFSQFDDIQSDAKHVALNRAKYQDSVDMVDDSQAKYTYIEDVVIPEVYGDLLIEQYLLDEDVAAVRSSRARKINVIKIEKYSTFSNNADKLVNALVNEIYSTLPAENEATVRTDNEAIEKWGEALFEKYEMIAKGLWKDINNDEAAKDIVDELHRAASVVYEEVTPKVGNLSRPDLTYYKNTTYGDLVEDYVELLGGLNDWNTLDTSEYSSFTSNGSRTVEEGFAQKTIDIMQSKSITKGWYIKSSTPSLDSNGTINDRLFKMSVSNGKIEVGKTGEVETDVRDAAIRELTATDRVTREEGTWKVRENSDKETNRFICSINGAYFLKFEDQYSGSDWKKDIVYDDGNAYYIVQVLEAVSESKLKNLTDGNYVDTRGQATMNSIIDQVAKLVGETGSYASLSKNHWLEKMGIKYHDQNIYDFFKSNYPDLFEDEE